MFIYHVRRGPIKEVEMDGARGTHGYKKNAYRVLMEKLEGQGTLQRPRRRWENNTKIDLKVMGWKGGDWINGFHYAHVAGSCGHGNELSGFHRMSGIP
jgi:hypothetical protein